MSRKYRTEIGVDEAGYGPLLGPLVVAVSAFRVPSGAADLRDLLPVTGESRGPVPVDDSKRVYRGGGGLEALERTVLAFRACAARAEVPDPGPGRRPWELGEVPEGPIVAAEADVARSRQVLDEALAAADVTPLGIRTRTVGVEEFNRGVERWGTKARVLFETNVELLRPWIDGPGETVVHADRHGGRSHYSSLLAGAFPDRHQWVIEEGRRISRYRLPHEAGETEISFEVGADGRHLCTALASMCAKYVRELHMRVFNAYFSAADPDLEPTAGYVADARRWLEESRSARRRRGVSREELIRVR